LYFVYVLYSKRADRIYAGHTDNLALRLERHNQGKVRSTKPYSPWEIIYTEPFSTRGEAMKREKALKSYQGRQFIRNMLLKGKTQQSAAP